LSKWLLLSLIFLCSTEPAHAQLTAPTITATAKGPDQINLTWSAATSPGYGYLVEIQSAGDSRYSSFTQLQTIPNATGYTASSGNACQVSDTNGTYVYNPQSLGSSAHLYGLPTWVVESNYVDPQDGTAAQFMAFGLKPNTSYSFRVRTYTPTSYSSYSNTASATTANYSTVRYISTTGSDSNGGTNSTTDAWLTFYHASHTVSAGTLVLAEAGSYPSDEIWPTNGGSSATAKVVYEADSGASVTITSAYGSGPEGIYLGVSYVVIDGINIVATDSSDVAVQASSASHDVLANLSIGPLLTALPNTYGIASFTGSSYMLVYQVYMHDSQYPCSAQNPSGNAGSLFGENPDTNDVIMFNHLTRGAHDTGVCKGGSSSALCENNAWLDNVMDGGYGLCWEDVFYGESNLVEGNVCFGAGRLESGIYKPGFEISGPSTTMRRNIVLAGSSHAQEISSLNSINVPNFKIYNNVWYEPGGDCFWINGSVSSTSGVIANNICYSLVGSQGYPNPGLAFSYVTDTTNTITHNDLLYVSGGVGQPSTANISWDITGGGSCSSSPCTISQVDSLLSPPWSSNASLAVLPQFVNPGSYDFHLQVGSPIVGAGAAVTDSAYGSFSSGLDLGPFQFTAGVLAAPPTKLLLSLK